MAPSNEIVAVGRRKSATARVRIKPGTGVITVNGKPVATYMARDVLVMLADQPFDATDNGGKWDVRANCAGGGDATSTRWRGGRRRPGATRRAGSACWSTCNSWPGSCEATSVRAPRCRRAFHFVRALYVSSTVRYTRAVRVASGDDSSAEESTR